MKKLLVAVAALSFVPFVHGEVKWKITALTPEYILVQADGSDDESTAFFADPRQAELIGSKLQEWQLARKRTEIQRDVEKNVRQVIETWFRSSRSSRSATTHFPRRHRSCRR